VFTAFDDVSVTVVSRMVRPDSSLASVVVSGRHVGAFAEAQPTGRPVRLIVDAVAVPAEEGGVGRLELSPDLRGLMAQLADSGDTLGLASAMVAAVRENEPREGPQWQVVEPPPHRRRALRGPGAVGARLVWS